jgi:hypothetical protein
VTVDAVLRAADALIREAQRRSRGEIPDRRFDLPLDVLADLADELDAPRDLDAPIVPKRPDPPPAGSCWCADHQVYDLCHADAA